MKTAADSASAEIIGEIKARKNSSGKLPVITGCAEGVGNFVKNFYPDLAANLIAEKTARRTFASVIKNGYAKEAGVESSAVTSVSLVPCLAQKYSTDKNKTDFALTAEEFARMINLAGIIIETLPEEQFDAVNAESPKPDNSVKKERACGFAQGRKIMEAIREGQCNADWVEILSCPGGKCN